MATVYPGAIDTFVNPTPANSLNTPAVLHSGQHANINDAVAAIETYVGVSGSLVVGTVVYRLGQLETRPPLHATTHSSGGTDPITISNLAGQLVAGQVPNSLITNAMRANMAQSTLSGRGAAAGTGVPTDLTVAQVVAIIAGTTSTTVPRGNDARFYTTNACDVGMTSNVNVSSGPATFDSNTIANGEVVLLTAQTTTYENGPWVYHGTGNAMTRPSYWSNGSVQKRGSVWHVMSYYNAGVNNGRVYGDQYGTDSGSMLIGTDELILAEIAKHCTFALTGDVTGSGTDTVATTIANNAVTNVKAADMATQTFKGRTTAGTGDPEDLTVAQAKTMLNLAGTNTGDQTITLTGGVTGSGTGSFVATVVTNANLTGVITSIGNATSIASQTGTGTKFVVDNTPTLITPILGVATATTINKVTITAPATGATLTIANGATLSAPSNATVSGTNTGDQTSIVGITGSLAEFNAALTGADFATGGGTVTGASSGTNTGDQTITLTGGVTGSGTGSFAATVVTNANLTGVITSVGNATSIASQTGTGTKFVVDNTPTLITPILGVATATTINKVTITAPATGSTLTIADGATLTASATATVSGTNTGDQTITLTGNVTGSGTGSFVTTIAAGVVTNAMRASMAQSTLSGRAASAGTGDPTDLSVSQVTTILKGTTSTTLAVGNDTRFYVVNATDVGMTSNVNVSSGPATFDSNTIANGEVVLLAAQTTISENGPWVYHGTGNAMTRPSYWSNGSVQKRGSVWHVMSYYNAGVNNGRVYGDQYGTDSGAMQVGTDDLLLAEIAKHCTFALTGDVTASGTDTAATTIANNVVTNAKAADMATQTFKGRTTAGTGDPEDLTVAQAKTMLNLSGTNTGDQTISLTGDVTGSGTGSFATTLVKASSSFSFTGDTSITVSGDTNDWAPAGFASLSHIRINPTGGTWKITGLAAGTNGRFFMLTNVSSTLSIGLAAGDALSLAANRFVYSTGTGVSNNIVYLGPGQSCIVYYAGSAWSIFAAPNFDAPYLFNAALADVASASTVSLLTLPPVCNITGTTTITAINIPKGSMRFVKFTGALTLTYDPTALILPGGADITTASGDTAIFESDGQSVSNVRCISYVRASAPPVSGTNTGDQASIVGITGTIAQFNTACTDADFATGGGTATGTNTGDQTITLSGAVTGSGTGAINVAMVGLVESNNTLTADYTITASNKSVYVAGGLDDGGFVLTDTGGYWEA